MLHKNSESWEKKNSLEYIAPFLALKIEFYTHYLSKFSLLVLSLLVNDGFAWENSSDLLLQVFVTYKGSHAY